MSIRECPFCNSKAKIVEDNWDNPNPGYGGNKGFKVECTSCAACSGTRSYATFNMFSKYSVKDFRESNLLRAREDARYEQHKDEIKYDVVKLWNQRHVATTYGGEEGACDHA